MAQHDTTITRSIRFPEPLLKALDDEADKRGISTQKLIAMLLESGMNQNPPNTGEALTITQQQPQPKNPNTPIALHLLKTALELLQQSRNTLGIAL